MSEPDETIAVNTNNEYALSAGTNLPNHSTSLSGRGKFVKAGIPTPPCFRTKQEVYRFCVYALILAEAHGLPDENGSHTFEQIQEAVANA